MRHVKIYGLLILLKQMVSKNTINSQFRSILNGRPIEKYNPRRGQKMETSEETPFEKTNVEYDII